MALRAFLSGSEWSALKLRAVARASLSTTTVNPAAYVSKASSVGKGCTIGAFAYVGDGVTIGDDSIIAPHATLLHCDVGRRVVINSGVRIGQDGFGFVVDEEDGSANHVKKPQELRVTIGDDVEIGANTTIDRGSWRNTTIHTGCKLDNLIQIGHNVVLGKGCLMAAQSGIAGSTTVGEKVMIGGQVGIAQHLTIGNNVRIAAKSGVMNDLDGNCTYGGYPATEILKFHRQTLFLRKQSGKEPATDQKDAAFNVIYVTVPSEKVGKDIGEKLVRERLAACVNIVPELQSIYKWEKQLEVDRELLLVIKSRKELFELVKWSVEESHPYDTPEVVSFSLDAISNKYRKWLEESLLSIS